MGAIENRLRRLEEQSHRCPDCRLAPDEPRKMAVIYEEDPERSFQGDPYECCKRCGHALYTVRRVVYDSPPTRRGEGGLLD